MLPASAVPARGPAQSGLLSALNPFAGEAKEQDQEQDQQDAKAGQDGGFTTDSDTLSIEEKNEKEVQRNPGQVTASAEAGIQKAEAAALVWSKKTVYCTYAW